MYDLVEHGVAQSKTALLQERDVQRRKHVGWTASLLIVRENESGCPTLYSFNLGLGHPGRWAPDGGSILQGWAHKGGVSLFFDGNWTGANVSPKETHGGICFLGYHINMMVPRKGRSDVSTKISCALHCF